MNKIVIVDYDPLWPAFFKKEAAQIKKILDVNCIEVHHIGSTSIPNLCAKPIIDILAVVNDIKEVDAKNKSFERMGYEPKGETGICFRRFFINATKNPRCHLHVFVQNSPEIKRHLLFKNWLLDHPEDALAYGNLKRRLATLFADDVFNYCQGKEPFILGIEAKNGYEGWRMVRPLTNKEWQAIHTLSEQNDLPIFAKEHYLVFYKNIEIVGFVLLEARNKNRFIFDKNKCTFDDKTLFENLVTEWLHHFKSERAK